MDKLKGLKHIGVFLTSKKSDKDRDGEIANNHQRRHKDGTNVVNPSSTANRRSVFGIPLKSKKKDSTTAEMVVQRQSERRKSKISPRDQRMQELHLERERLREGNTRSSGRIGRRLADLEPLRQQDEAGKWEDELYETRLKELNNAQATIDTRSTSGEDVMQQLKQLNQEICVVASLAARTPITRDTRQGGLENIATLLGEGFPVSFGNSWNRLDDQGLVRVILQVFLARACVKLIESWYLGEPKVDGPLNEFYDRIRSKEEQRVAGKWRQITFNQLRDGPDDEEALRKYTAGVLSGLLEVSSCAGWGGDTQEIQQRVEVLVKGAETIRTNVKGSVISADLQPWVASYGSRFDPTNMKNVSDDFGLHQVRDVARSHVLGSTEVGLRACRPTGDMDSELKELHSRTRVVLVEALGGQYRTRGR